MKRYIVLFLAFLFLLIPSSVLAATDDIGLDISPDKFALQFNKNLLSLDKTFPKFEFQKDDEIEDALIGNIFDFVSILAYINHNGNISNLFIVGMGDGSNLSGLIIFESFCSALAAADNEIELKETGDIVSDLVNGKIEKFTTKTIETAIVQMKDMGIWMLIDVPSKE